MNCSLASLGGCSRGFPDPHHCLEQKHIRNRFKWGGVRMGDQVVPLTRLALVEPEVTADELCADARNIRPLCRRHHDLHHGASKVHLDPPESAWEFARDVGLSSVLEKQAERRRAA